MGCRRICRRYCAEKVQAAESIMYLPISFPLSSYTFPAVPPAMHPIHLSLTRAAADYHGAFLTSFYNYLANSTNRIGGFLSLRICSIQICPLTVENNPCGLRQSKASLPKTSERCHRMCSVEGTNVKHISQRIYSFNAATHSISTSEPMGRPATLTQVLAYTVLKLSHSS